MKKLQYLMIHCTATPEGKDLTGADIKRMHQTPPPNGRGWKVPGYSDVIRLDGRIENLVPYDQDDQVQPREITNGAVGMNAVTRHVSYIGGVDSKGAPKNTMTDAQETALKNYVYDFLVKYPTAKVLGHNQVATKACPSFNVPKWLISINVQKSNIY